MGSGKSTVGAMVAKKLKRTALIHEDIIKWFISDFRRDSADNAMTTYVLKAMCKEYLRHKINLVIV